MWNYSDYTVVLATPLLINYSEYLNGLDMRLRRVLLNTLLNFATNARNTAKHHVSSSLYLQIILILMHLFSLIFSRFQKPKENQLSMF
jgi:hypothetical protein